jgi:preprotein translocase subunit YajC
LFITPAFAQASGISSLGSTDMLIQFAPFVVVLGIMYFLVLRPQQQRAKDQRAMIQGAKRGDTIVTSGGLIGKITKSTDDNEVEIEIAPNVRVRLARSGIAEVRARGEPAKEAAATK